MYNDCIYKILINIYAKFIFLIEKNAFTLMFNDILLALINYTSLILKK